MFNLSRPVKHSKERRKRLSISEAISPLKVAGEEHLATVMLLQKTGKGKVIILITLHILRQMQELLLLKNFLSRLFIEQMK